MKKILIADDHFAVRLGIELMVNDILHGDCTIDFARDSMEVLEKVKNYQYDMLITDLNMPGNQRGPALVEHIVATNAKIRVIVLTVDSELYFAELCFQAGARAFIEKSAPDTELRKAILTVIENHHYISDQQKDIFTQKLLSRGNTAGEIHQLSKRELEMARLLLKGFGVLEVANAMKISISTASTFKSRIFKKLRVGSIIELSRVASQMGFGNEESRLY